MTVDGLPDDWRSSHRARGGGSVRDIPRPYERGDRDQPVLVRADGGKPRVVVVAKVRSDQPSGPRPCRRPSRGRVSCRCDPIHFGARSHRVGGHRGFLARCSADCPVSAVLEFPAPVVAVHRRRCRPVTRGGDLWRRSSFVGSLALVWLGLVGQLVCRTSGCGVVRRHEIAGCGRPRGVGDAVGEVVASWCAPPCG